MELGLLKGEKIRVRDHKLGIWMIDVLSYNENTTYTLALRDEEADRVCLL
jgi:Fe2+ transport system protein FeoA